MIDVAHLCSAEWTGKVVPVLFHQAVARGLRIARFFYLLAEDNVRSPLGPHNGDLRRGIGEIDVRIQVLAGHGDIGSAVCLARHHGYLGNRGLAVGIDNLGPVLDDPSVLLLNPGEITGNIYKCNQWNVEGIAGTHEACTLHGCFDVQATGQETRLIRHDPHRHTVEAAETHDHVHGIMLMRFQKHTVVQHLPNKILHIVRKAGIGGDQLVEPGIDSSRIVRTRRIRRTFPVVLGKVGQKLANPVQGVPVRVFGEMGHTALGVVGHGSAQVLR